MTEVMRSYIATIPAGTVLNQDSVDRIFREYLRLGRWLTAEEVSQVLGKEEPLDDC